ncbi:MAG: metal-sensitive transcriptional regulator [Actinomycetota bacterium]|nr:metal-sensitive transcriptional regulator [Actinomycetota bacterium]MDD5666432.1 metal-sensitive transcriptional regulator [Actinomycetota bacterium]
MSKSDDNREAILNRLNRVEGQVRGIIRMVEDEKDCEEVLMQVAAVRSAMDRIGIHIITHRMRDCLSKDKSASPEDAVADAIDFFLRFSSRIGPVTPE